MRIANADIAIIGGSGLYEMEGLESVEYVSIDTPFGKPSDDIVLGILGGVNIAFLPRHGRGHRFNPTNIPVRANIYALKTLGVRRIISVSAVGSLKEELAPLDLVIPDQMIDRTRLRTNTFFEEGLVVHVAFGEPFCANTSKYIAQSASEVDVTAHMNGTMIVMEGPAFSTKAESFMYRSWGADIIGMTALPEAKLAREAEICYSTMAWVTDYDCWHADTEAVTVDMVIKNLLKNVENSKEMIRRVVPLLPEVSDCSCGTALQDAIITRSDQIPSNIKSKLDPIIGKYIN